MNCPNCECAACAEERRRHIEQNRYAQQNYEAQLAGGLQNRSGEDLNGQWQAYLQHERKYRGR